MGIRQILRAKKAVKDLSRTNTRVQSTASDVQPSIVARLSGEGVVPWMGHALEADMGSNTKETRVDVSPYFVALTEKSSRNVDDSTFSVARYVCLDVALGTTFASMWRCL